jgi:hypothetical protein
MQKCVLQIMTKSGHRDSCRQRFKNWGILPFYSQYIFSPMLFVARNTHLYTTNQETHGVNTRHNTDFHFPTMRLTPFKGGVYFMGMKIFNHLPTNIKILSNKIELFLTSIKEISSSTVILFLEEYLVHNMELFVIKLSLLSGIKCYQVVIL